MAFLEKMKKGVNDLSEKTKKRLAMEGLLQQACLSLEDYFSPKIVKPEARWSKELFRNAQGIALISEGKGGFMFAGKAGTGVVLCRIPHTKDEWSGPLAIGTGGISWGLQAGIAKCDHIILLQTPHHVHTFMAKGAIQIGGNAQAAMGNIGRDASMGVGASEKAVAPILSYSFKSEGLYGGISIEGAIITSRNDCNDEYYNIKNVKIEDIITGKVKNPQSNNIHYNKIIQLLNEYCNAPHPIEQLCQQSILQSCLPSNSNSNEFININNNNDNKQEIEQQISSNNNNNNNNNINDPHIKDDGIEISNQKEGIINNNNNNNNNKEHDDDIDITQIDNIDNIDNIEPPQDNIEPPHDNQVVPPSL
jgi:lipid-binding SYLF domain-containing protein